eukprot:SAG31_NODE_16170_length_720_cov_0.990338_1_plen_110_part_00
MQESEYVDTLVEWLHESKTNFAADNKAAAERIQVRTNCVRPGGGNHASSKKMCFARLSCVAFRSWCLCCLQIEAVCYCIFRSFLRKICNRMYHGRSDALVVVDAIKTRQ